MGDLSEHFSRWEFACRCGCGFDDVDEKLITKLEILRAALAKPIHITSGCRCHQHNDDVGGVPNSAHTRGTAVDFSCQGGSNRYWVMKHCLGLFKRIGVARTFIHVDVDEELLSPSLWSY